MKYAMVLVLLLVVTSRAFAEPFDPFKAPGYNPRAKVGEVLQRLHGNITGASSGETAELVVTKITGGEVGGHVLLARLIVVAADGRTILWKGPIPSENSQSDNPYSFNGYNTPGGHWDAGLLLQIVGDIDGSGRGEVVAYGDSGRGNYYNVYRWNGSGLAVIHGRENLTESSPGSGHFVWGKIGYSSMYFKRVISPGRCEVEVFIRGEEGLHPDVVKAVADGFVLVGSQKPRGGKIWDYEEVGLSPDQSASLKQAVADLEARISQRKEQIGKAQSALNVLINAEASEDALTSKLAEIAQLQEDMKLADLMTVRRVNEILTPEQLSRWHQIQSRERPQTPAGPSPPAPRGNGKVIWDYEQDLHLTQKQISSLRQIVANLQTRLANEGKSIKAADAELQSMNRAGGPEAELRSKLDEIGRMQIEMRIADVMVARRISHTLTPQQLARWRQIQGQTGN